MITLEGIEECSSKEEGKSLYKVFSVQDNSAGGLASWFLALGLSRLKS